MSVFLTFVRVALGLFWLALLIPVGIPSLVILLPFPRRRARVGSAFAQAAGWGLARLTGSTYEVHGRRHLDPARPAVFVSNHTSLIDIFLAVWLAPRGTLFISKREILLYPFVGLGFWLTGGLAIDRKRPAQAGRALKRFAGYLARHRLGAWLWPEGTRSKDGHLRTFKSGFVTLAVRAGIPVVPVVVRGAHRAWPLGSYALCPTTVRVDVLEPVDTSRWTEKTARAHADEIHRMFERVLDRPYRPRLDEEPLAQPAPAGVSAE